VDGENPNLYFHKDDVLLCLLPLFHIYSLNSVLLAGLRAGSTIVIMRKFDLGALVGLVRRYRITIAPFVPPIVVEIAKSDKVTADDLASIRMVMSGAAPMGKDLQDAFMAKIPNAVLGQVGTATLLPHRSIQLSCCLLLSYVYKQNKRATPAWLTTLSPTGIRDDRGRARAGNVPGVRQGAVRGQVRVVRHGGAQRRAQDRRPRHRRRPRPEPARRDLHPRGADHERYCFVPSKYPFHVVWCHVTSRPDADLAVTLA
jgi:hypothetical protein